MTRARGAAGAAHAGGTDRARGAAGAARAGGADRARGAALIEALVAAAILALALLPLGQSLTMAVQAVRASGRHLQAAGAVQTTAEQARREAAADFAAFAASGTRVTAEGAFTVRRTVSAPPGTPPGTALVEVAVTSDGGPPLVTVRFLLHPEGF